MEISRADGVPKLLVDAGNLLFDRQEVRPDNAAKITNAEMILEIYRELEYDAIAVGPLDLAAGPELLLRPQFDELPLLSANLYDTAGERLFDSHLTLERAGLKLACIGLTGPLEPFHDTKLRTADPEQELSRLLPSLAAEHDLIMLLSSLPHEELRALLGRFPTIDLAVGADFSKNRLPPVLLGQTLVVQGDRQGKYLDYLSVDWLGRPWQDRSETRLIEIKQRLAAIEAQLRHFQPRPQESETSIARRKAIFLKNRRDLKRELTRLQSQGGTALQPGSSYQASTVPLHGSVPDDPRILEIIEAYRQQQNR